MSSGPLIPRDESALEAAIDRYIGREPGPEPIYAAPELERATRQGPHGSGLEGRTAGEWARLAERLEGIERDSLQRQKPGSGVDTELRDVLHNSSTYARGYAHKSALLRAAQRIQRLRRHRIRVCMRYMSQRGPRDERTGDRVVEVVGRIDRQPELGAGAEILRASYRGIVVCGNGWVCPCCAAKITEQRRKELRRGVKRWRDRGGAVVLQTFTFSHGPADDLREQWQQLSRALQVLARGKVFKEWRRVSGFKGRIRSREITFGINGWHPHSHALELCETCPPELVDEWRPLLAREWQRCCAVVGLSSSLDHGFDMQITTVDDYIAKWGLDAELTKWHVKSKGHAAELEGLNGYSPFDLLRVFADELIVTDPRLRLTPDRAAQLFADYAEAVKGSAQLHWTRGLKAELELDELSDAEIADGIADDADTIVLGRLNVGEWNVIQTTNRQLEFLGLCQSGGFEYAKFFLALWRDELREYSRRVLKAQQRSKRLEYLWRGSPKKLRRAA